MINSYVVRIYRHLANKPENLVGTVQSADSQEQQGFSGYEELWAILQQQQESATRPEEE